MAEYEQQQMFPELEEPQYTSAPDLGLLAEELFSQRDELSGLANELRSGRLNIAYLWDNRPFNSATEELKHNTVARTMKAPAVWEALTGYQLVIVVRKQLYASFTPTQRSAVIFHELLHIDATPGRLRLRPHDLEEFALVVRYYGSYLPDRKYFFKQWRVWQAEQDLVKPDDR